MSDSLSSLVLSTYNGDVFGPDYTAAVTGVTFNDAAQTFTVDDTQFTGSFADYNSGLGLGTDVVATTIGVVNNDIISYNFTYDDGSTGPTLGGAVIGVATDGSLLVDQINGFVQIGNSYIGTLSNNHYDIFDTTTDLSGYQGNEAANPALPLVFNVPEPSSFAIFFVAIALLAIARVRRGFGF